MCSKCRYHVQVAVSYANARVQSRLGHIHHLVYHPQRQGDGQYYTTSKGQHVETYRYECSFLSCSVLVSVTVASPILNPGMVRILTDPEQLRKRADEAIAAYPERFSDSTSRPRPINVLENLRTYISDSLTSKNKSISATNKRFIVSFGIRGIPCKEVLEFLEFKAKVPCLPF